MTSKILNKESKNQSNMPCYPFKVNEKFFFKNEPIVLCMCYPDLRNYILHVYSCRKGKISLFLDRFVLKKNIYFSK